MKTTLHFNAWRRRIRAEVRGYERQSLMPTHTDIKSKWTINAPLLAKLLTIKLIQNENID